MKRFLAFTLMAAMALTLSACESQSDNAQIRSVANDETASLQEDLSALQKEYDSLKEDYSALQSEHDTLKEDFSKTQEDLSKTQEEFSLLQDAKAEADSLIETLTGEKETVSKALEEANQKLTSQEEILSQTQALVDSLQENYDTLEDEYATYRHKAEGGRLVIPDEILKKYEQLAQEASTKVTQVLDEELTKMKEEAFEAISGLLVAPDTSRDADTYDASYFLKGAESITPVPGSLRYEQ